MNRSTSDRREFICTTLSSGLGLTLASVGSTAAAPRRESIAVGVITQADGAHLGAYFAALAQTPETQEVSLYDPSGNSVEDAKRRLGAKLKAVHRTQEELLGSKPAMVLVSLEARAAPAAIDAALDAGCHVFAEKPACVRAEDFAALVSKATAGKRHLMLAFANRILPRVSKARELISSGAIGKIYGVEAHIIADQTRLKNPAYRQKWYAIKARAGGGHLSWLGIHWLDMISHITGLTVEQVTGFAGVVGGQPIDVEDSAVVALKFSSGAFGTLTSGYYLDKRYHSHVKVWGADGWLDLAPIEKKLTWYNPEHSPDAQNVEVEERPGGYTPFVRKCVRASAGLEAPPITGAEGLAVLRTIFAFYEAAETGQAQRVKA